jgi:predicted outer membrane repeat protein
MCYLKTCLTIAAILAAASIGFAGTIHVPADQPTIQAGIDAAVDGDTVLVADGTYVGEGNHDIEFDGKNIILMSEHGADLTIIDCDRNGRGFYFGYNDRDVVVKGFTITDGWAEYGGGIYCYEGSEPVITENVITENEATTTGGGIYCDDYCSPTIRDNVIIGNNANGGGGIMCNGNQSAAYIEGNSITENDVIGNGGGIACYLCDNGPAPYIIRNYISENSATYGGGISLKRSPALALDIVENVIVDNEAWEGGGIRSYSSRPSILRNIIAGNVAVDVGGGIYNFGEGFAIINNTITGNEAEGFGGGGGIYQEAVSNWSTIRNTIVWGNSGSSFPEIYPHGGGTLVITYSDIGEEWMGEGNINEDPRFVNPMMGDYNLSSDSPCIDTGDPDDPPDPDGTRVDMGALYYRQIGRVHHVPDDYATIQDAINAAENTDTVLVANGTYTGTGNRDIDFLGKAIVVMSASGPESCMIDCEGTSEDWHRGFYFHNGETSGSVVQGFTIQNGYEEYGGAIFCEYNSSPIICNSTFKANFADWAGGAISCFNSSPTISNNTFTLNSTYSSGGAISCLSSSSPTISGNTFTANHAYYYGGPGGSGHGGAISCNSSSPTVSGNTFTANSADDDGGAIICSLFSSPNISGNTFTENSAGYGGGSICCWDSSPTISNNTFTANNGYYGGAIHCWGSSPAVSGNTFTENYADYGGAISCDSSSPAVSGNTFTANSAYYSGGAIHCWYYSSPTVSGDTFTANSADYGGAIYCDSSSLTIKNCILWGDTPDGIVGDSTTVTYSDVQGGWQGEGNIDADPLFVDPENGDYHLQSTSPCIDAGDPDSPPDPDGTRADMGAYYFHQSPPPVLTLSVVPDTTYYHKGDQLGFTVTVTNNTDSTVFFQGWSEGETPWGLILSPLLGPINAFLGPHRTISPHLRQQIPMKTPYGGPYTYRVKVGEYPNSVYAEDWFEFYVVPPGVPQRYDDWEVIEGAKW